MQTPEVHRQHNTASKRRIALAVGSLLTASLLALGYTAWQHNRSPALSQRMTSVNMLTQDWRYMPGVTQHDRSIDVQPTGLAIVKQDGSGGQPNPPVNEYGTHLSISGNFEVTANITHNLGTASLQLYDTLPVIADEFRIEPASLRLTESGDQLVVQVIDGSPQTSVQAPTLAYQQTFTVPDGGQLAIKRQDDTIDILSGDQMVTSLPWGGIFNSGELWFGLDSSTGGYEVSSLQVQGLGGNQFRVVNTTQQDIAKQPGGLQALANMRRPGFKVGAAVALGPLVADKTYAGQVLSNFGSVTLENAMKPQFLSPKQGVYTFQEADALVALAHKNNMTVHGHTLAFSEAEPAWMRNLPTATAADRTSTSAILLDYVSHVVQHFKGQLDSLDVINEPLDTDQGTSLQQNIWYKAMGPSYMAQVSKLVHAIDPGVKQYVNENGAEAAGDRQNALLQLLQSSNAQGGFIYGVGLQAHVYDMSTDAIDGDSLNDTINRFGAAGFKVRISENDVTDDNGTRAQASQYAAVFKTCFQNPNCISYTTWGVNDRYDWFVDDDGSLQQGYDFLFNDSRATSAYTALQQQLH